MTLETRVLKDEARRFVSRLIKDSAIDGAVLDEARDEASRLILQDPGLQGHPVLRDLLENQQRKMTAAGQLN